MSEHMIDQRLKQLRRERGVSQGQIAEYAGVSQSTFSDLETGKISPKSLDVLYKVAKHYNVSLDWLFGLADTPQPITIDNKKLPGEAEELFENYSLLSAGQRWIVVQLCRLMVLSEESQNTQKARQLLEEINDLLDKDME